MSKNQKTYTFVVCEVVRRSYEIKATDVVEARKKLKECIKTINDELPDAKIKINCNDIKRTKYHTVAAIDPDDNFYFHGGPSHLIFVPEE